MSIDKEDYEMHKRFAEELEANIHPKQALMEEEISQKLKRAELDAENPQCKKMDSIIEKLKVAYIESESAPKPNLTYVLQNVVAYDRVTEFSVKVQFTSARMASEFINKIGEVMK